MSFKDLLDQTQLLVSSLIIHCHENQSAQALTYGKKIDFSQKKIIDTSNELPIPRLETPPPPTILPKKPEEPQKAAKVSPEKKPAPIKEPPRIIEVQKETPLPPAHIHFPFIQTLSTAIAKPQKPSFTDIVDKIKQFNSASFCHELISECAIDESMTWKKEYPNFALISFFPKGSEEEIFLQKVAQAIASRLSISSAFFTMPTFQTAAELACFSSSGSLKTAVFAYDLSLQQKASEWLAYFPSLEPATEHPEAAPLTLKRKLFSTPFYQLALPPHYEQALDFKAALWKALQHILLP